MSRFDSGDRVRVDIPDKTDPDHERYHGREGIVTEVLSDDADMETGNDRAGMIYRVELDDGPVVDLRWRDLSPPLSES